MFSAVFATNRFLNTAKAVNAMLLDIALKLACAPHGDQYRSTS
jgi:hypothetical protein